MNQVKYNLLMKEFPFLQEISENMARKLLAEEKINSSSIIKELKHIFDFSMSNEEDEYLQTRIKEEKDDIYEEIMLFSLCEEEISPRVEIFIKCVDENLLNVHTFGDYLFIFPDNSELYIESQEESMWVEIYRILKDRCEFPTYICRIEYLTSSGRITVYKSKSFNYGEELKKYREYLMREINQ